MIKPVPIQLPGHGIAMSVGTDIAEVERIQRSCERHGQRFLDRIFTEQEQAYCQQMQNPYPHYAARFAAKEAVSKAFTTGIGAEVSWRGIEVIKGERQQPLIRLGEAEAKFLQSLGGTDVLISIAHIQSLATAYALIVQSVDSREDL